MVEQMVSSNLSKYGLGKCASIISSSDKQPLPMVVAAKNTTVRDVQNDKNAPANSGSQKEEDITQPFQAKSPPGGSNVNRNLVYARRKSDTELNRTSGHQQSPSLGDKTLSPQIEAKIEANDCVQSFAPVQANCEILRQPAVVNSPAMEHWNARFARLQKYLKQCDGLNHEVYLHKLRSFSPDECSKRAVELERRAIHLMLEEGREIQRVKDLNVLGKSAGNHPLLRPMTPVFKSEKLV